MKQGTIAGPFDPLYPEVMQKLRAEVKTLAARWVYLTLVSMFAVEEDWEAENPVWVSGSVRANKIDIAKESGVNWKYFSSLWQQLIGAGLVEEATERRFIIPFYKKKAYDSISAREVRERFARLEDFMNGNGQDGGGESPETDGPQEADDHPEKKTEEVDRESGGWIQRRLTILWPGKVFDAEADAQYIQELENYTRPELQAAFDRAQKDGAIYGNYEYLLNYLRNPSHYNEKPKTKSKEKGVEPESKLFGTLKAAWMKK